MIRILPFLLLVMIAAGCESDTSRPFHWSVGTLTVEGIDYYSVLIYKLESDGIHTVGGFVSDETLGNVTIGPDSSPDAPLQISPDEGVIVYHGKKHTIEDDGFLVWIIDKQTYEQTLDGFPLEETLQRPAETPDPPEAQQAEQPL